MNGSAVYGIMAVIIGLVIWRRTRAMVRPIQGSGIKILLPIIYILPVFSLFSQYQLQVKIWEFAVASLIGILLSVPLMLTTNYEIRQDGHIYAQKNKSFFIALIAVVAIRIVLRQVIPGMDPASLSMLFFTVAFSYILPWRIVSFVKFKKIKQSQAI
ncbi:cobalamin biosynthesis protein CbiX [Bacillus sp. MUM 116]|uniref:cytochrome c biogenesis protein CcdC n=1 Tax=Bacillus sp. MUM 116 TaxID=1678002 RepID=UPI0008F5E1B2|nr:cytochrome c biogenesis protein CcdC [Bacillus sp. MUM 116]OIK04286.1 cobalamin biosynthesis protein CbiX [Bacillus sp. MUM 116]